MLGPTSLRVAVLAPSAVVRAGLEALLRERAEVTVAASGAGEGGAVGRGGDPSDESATVTLASALALEPDVILWALDAVGRAESIRAVRGLIGSSDRSGGAAPGESVYAAALDLDERIVGGAPGILLLADVRAERGWEGEALEAGAAGVLPADATGEEIAAAVLAVGAGLVVLPRSAVRTLVRAAGRGRGGVAQAVAVGGTGADRSSSSVAALSGRERQVLALLAEGLPNKVIAPRLGISEHTVKAHVAAIFEKLGAGTRAEAVVTAARQGLLML